MAQRGRPAGTTGAVGAQPEKLFGAALRAAVLKTVRTVDPETGRTEMRRNLDLIAEALVEKAKEGSLNHTVEVANRLDGKVPDAVVATDAAGDGATPLQGFTVTFVTPKTQEAPPVPEVPGVRFVESQSRSPGDDTDG